MSVEAKKMMMSADEEKKQFSRIFKTFHEYKRFFLFGLITL